MTFESMPTLAHARARRRADARGRGAVVLVLVALSLGLATPAQAQWRWKDRAGQMHASDQAPPPDIPDKDILARPRNAKPFPLPVTQGADAAASAALPASAASGPSKLEAEVEARKQKAEQDEKARKKAVDDANAATRAENCARARQGIATLESGQRIARVNAQGEREVLDDKARADEMQRARGIAASECK